MSNSVELCCQDFFFMKMGWTMAQIEAYYLMFLQML